MAIKHRIKKYAYLHLWCVALFALLITSFCLTSTQSFKHPLWPNIRISMLFLSILFSIVHMTLFIFILRIANDTDPLGKIKTLVGKQGPVIKSFQITALVGLSLALFDLFFSKTTFLLAMGIALLITFGIEFIIARLVTWSLEEDIRRMERNS